MSWKPLSNDPSPPQRLAVGGYGTVGRRIRLTTNHFEVTIDKKKLSNIKLIHYDVTIQDAFGKETLPRKKKMMIFEKYRTEKLKNVAIGYDSAKNAYSTVPISNLSKPIDVEIKEEEGRKSASKFTIKFEKVNEAMLQDLYDSLKYIENKKHDVPLTLMQMIEVMFRHYRSINYMQVSGRNFFSLNEEFARANEIGGGKQGLTGFFGSLRPAAWKNGSLLLNLDMAHTAFYKPQPVIDFLKENIYGFDPRRKLEDHKRKMVDKCLKGLKLRTIHVQRTYKFLKVVDGADDDRSKFEYEVPGKPTKKVTIAYYMKNHYNISLQFPSLNCLHVGNPKRTVYIPMELCHIDKGQRVTKKLSDREVSTFIRSTAVPPAQRLSQIKEVARTNNFKDDQMLKSLCFSISDKPLETEGRVLPAPSLTMVQKNFQPYQGVWDIRDKQFHVAAELKTWAVINYDGYKANDACIRKFLDMLVSMGNQKGMKMSKPFDIYTSRERDPVPLADFSYYKEQNPDIQLIMCILPGRKYYGAIKKAGDTVVNIISQCVLSQNVSKCQPQTVGNILLKINAKMGGVNNIITGNPQFRTGLLNFKEPFLIMGADVNHPPAGTGRGIPSLAAVVGSYDMHATKYAMELRSQTERMEIITDLTSIVKNLIMNFYKKTNRHKPQRLIMYRDGVSESQFKQVLAQEMLAMRKACTMIDKSYTPGITFICVQKRHHTRLFCDERDGVGKSKNVPPGTIIDRDITHPTERDFFLCSHQGIQGTSKPTHYHVLWDDNDLPIDELQQLTYRLCHVYSRCSRTVSIPTPVYYAHLAAFRAKVYVTEILDGGSESGSILSGGSCQLNTKQLDEIRRTTFVNMEHSLASKLHYI